MLLQDCHALQRSKLKLANVRIDSQFPTFDAISLKVDQNLNIVVEHFNGILAALREIPDTCRKSLHIAESPGKFKKPCELLQNWIEMRKIPLR